VYLQYRVLGLPLVKTFASGPMIGTSGLTGEMASICTTGMLTLPKRLNNVVNKTWWFPTGNPLESLQH
jgi:hypothetical protein